MALADLLCDPSSRLVIAHRGDSINGGENTLEALQRGVSLGADALEFDVRMTRDGVAVLMHDPHLDRTTDGRGRVDAHAYAEIRALNAHLRAPPGSAPVQVPTLDDVLEAFPRLPLVVEVKEVAAVEPTERAIRRHGLQENVVVGSVELEVSARLARTGLRTCASLTDAALLIPLALLGFAPSHPAYDVLSLTPNFHGLPVPIAAMTEVARKAGVATQVWTVNAAAQARALWDVGVSGIITDDPGAIVRSRQQ